MQYQDMPDPGRVLDETQQCVLCVLLAPVGCGLCSMRELGVAIGDQGKAEFAVEGLHADGLVHRLGEFVFVTRAVMRARELELLAVCPSL